MTSLSFGAFFFRAPNTSTPLHTLESFAGSTQNATRFGSLRKTFSQYFRTARFPRLKSLLPTPANPSSAVPASTNMSLEVILSARISSVIMVLDACPAEKTNSTGSGRSPLSPLPNSSAFLTEMASICFSAASMRVAWSETPAASTKRARFVAASSTPHPRAVSHGMPARFLGPTSAMVTFASSAARAHPSIPFSAHISRSSSSGAPIGR
jgi:hypothetical protein